MTSPHPAKLLLAASLLASPALAQGKPPGMVEWAIPVTPAYAPQTDAQAEEGRQRGRALPEPEALQPTLDPALAPYRKRDDIRLSGSIKGGASDVLADLSHRWAAAFETLYPDVHVEISPPYAGSLGADELATGGLDFVFVSRELRPVDLAKFTAKFGVPPTSVPVLGGTYRDFGFLDAVGFYVHPDNPLSGLTYGQLDEILSSTHARGGEPITEWGQLGLTGEWVHAPIHVYGVKPWNGFEEFVRQRVLSTPSRRGECSSANFLTQYLAVRAGLKPSDVSPVAVGAGGTFIAALKQGAIDGGMTTEPTIARAVSSGLAKILVDMRTEEGTRAALGGPYPGACLYMTEPYVKAHPDITQKLANAYVRTLRYIAATSAEEIASKMPKDYYAGDRAAYVKALAGGKAMFTPDGIMPSDGPETVLKVLSTFSPTLKGKTVDLSQTFTTRFAVEAGKTHT